MKEMMVRPGDRIDLACERLVTEAPAFMVFNGTRVEATTEDTVQAVYDRWSAARPPYVDPADELARLRAENELLQADRELFRRWIVSHEKYLVGHKDYACQRCRPESEIIVSSFVCAYHRALDIEPLPSEGDDRG